MTKRRLLLLGLILAVLTFGSWFWGRPKERHLRLENIPAVRAGQSLVEVEELLGGPPGNYGRNAGGPSAGTCEGYYIPRNAIRRVWCDDSNCFIVFFNSQDEVVSYHKLYGYAQAPPESLLVRFRQSVRRTLGL